MNRSRIYVLILLLLTFTSAEAQVISLFNWDSDPNPLVAAVGPNGVSISTDALRDTPGTSPSYGLNPGCKTGGFCASLGCGSSSCRSNIALTVPNTGSIFDLPEMEFSMDYRSVIGATGSWEQEGYWFSRGSYFFFGFRSDGRLVYRFRVDDGAGGFNEVTNECWGCSVAALPTAPVIFRDGNWHTYGWSYDQATGVATVWIDGVAAFMHPSVGAGRALYWSGAPAAIVIGDLLDGMGNNVSQLDNATIQAPTPMPATIGYFEGEQQGLSVLLDWETLSESNNKSFIIERGSPVTQKFEKIGEIAGSGNSNSPLLYQFTDRNPHEGTNLYKLFQVDYNGVTTLKSVIEVNTEFEGSGLISVYPNPAEAGTELFLSLRAAEAGTSHVQVMDLQGRNVLQTSREVNEGMNTLSLPLEGLGAGMYMVQMQLNGRNYVQKVMLTK